ncbi:MULTISPECIES: hypothetical protein [unclassified Rhizobium]|uniref:hypothetical protein n=1 Tax=unclassified Rhizobium TaxID=2613769 RepID=UPI001ADCFD98|nr:MULTISPECIES: hypothetical protein [unclassified Rhizobium]MBO9101512.1 hypothetical protein [Rhizobium sp. L58/93]MBO9187505.1 hypothetical protein [Rhizobium sp. E27B/91]QXZ86708.1 hypothetical protein J5287_18995 [Rhizobium sp. K1/93]QXZ93259.1 hypothetical protein J5280_21900 [Rhizobium sp. K15/93]QYA03602.1 hypothetical protein J5278_22620 [Rhizobium sp. B21/90]
MTTQHTRADILANTLEKFRGAGVPIDADPILRGWLEAWVDGGLKMSDIAQRYQDLLKQRLSVNAKVAGGDEAEDPLSLEHNHRLMDRHELLEEVAKLLSEKPEDGR